MILKKKKMFNDFAASQGLRATRRRNVILDAFLSTQHISVEELYLKKKPSNPGIGHATVYRKRGLFFRFVLKLNINFITRMCTNGHMLQKTERS